MNNYTLYNHLDGFNEFDTDLTLDNVNPWLLLAAYTGAVVA